MPKVTIKDPPAPIHSSNVETVEAVDIHQPASIEQELIEEWHKWAVTDLDSAEDAVLRQQMVADMETCLQEGKKPMEEQDIKRLTLDWEKKGIKDLPTVLPENAVRIHLRGNPLKRDAVTGAAIPLVLVKTSLKPGCIVELNNQDYMNNIKQLRKVKEEMEGLTEQAKEQWANEWFDLCQKMVGDPCFPGCVTALDKLVEATLHKSKIVDLNGVPLTAVATLPPGLREVYADPLADDDKGAWDQACQKAGATLIVRKLEEPQQHVVSYWLSNSAEQEIWFRAPPYQGPTEHLENFYRFIHKLRQDPISKDEHFRQEVGKVLLQLAQADNSNLREEIFRMTDNYIRNPVRVDTAKAACEAADKKAMTAAEAYKTARTNYHESIPRKPGSNVGRSDTININKQKADSAEEQMIAAEAALKAAAEAIPVVEKEEQDRLWQEIHKRVMSSQD